jgi:hypothetical protein
MENVWLNEDSIAAIDKIYHGVPIDTLAHFKKVGEKLNLDPFSNEISIQQTNDKHFVIIGRDGYRKTAKLHSQYDYHWVAPLFANDTFKVVNGVPEHTKCLSGKSSVVGAYGVLKRKDATQPYFWQVEYDEYATDDEFWDERKGKPATMIAKVCEVQLIRLGFQELFSSTYDEVELLSGANKTQKKELIEFIRDHSDLAMKYIKDIGLLEMDEDELQTVVDKIKKDEFYGE